MANSKAVFIMLLLILGVIGFFWGISLQISFEPTTDSYNDTHLGKKVFVASIVVFVAGIMLMRRWRK